MKMLIDSTNKIFCGVIKISKIKLVPPRLKKRVDNIFNHLNKSYKNLTKFMWEGITVMTTIILIYILMISLNISCCY